MYGVQRKNPSKIPGVFNVNAFDFDNYSSYDFLYMYRPIESHITYRKLVNLVCNMMKSGSVLYQYHLSEFPTWYKRKFKILDNDCSQLILQKM